MDTRKKQRDSLLGQKVRPALITIVLLALALMLAPEGAFAQPVAKPVTPAGSAQLQAVQTYWTPERMRAATPMPVETRVQSGQVAVGTTVLPPDATPAFAPGWERGRGPQPPADLIIEIDPNDPRFALAMAEPQTTPPFVPPGFPTDLVNYAPFQRWTWYGRYLTYPTSTIGKLFFTIGVSNFVCSASVIQRNTIATAGHCVSDGAGNFHTNFLFCPSFNAGGANPVTDCWAAIGGATSGNWHLFGNIDRDYACLVTSPTGGVPAGPIGDTTGWLGRGMNLAVRQPEHAWGYPAAAPFPGFHIITVTSTEWYQVNIGGVDVGQPVDQFSKYIGSDMTGGSSGGPWWLNTRHPVIANEYADTDASNITDPFQGNASPMINGVNSHKRCLVNCGAPGPASGLFYQEMGSPPFLNTVGDTDESEDVFALCFANGGT